MSNLAFFLKKNKAVRESTTFPVTKSLRDDKGNPLLWHIKPLTTKQDEAIRDACTIEVPIKGKSNMFRNKVDTNKYISKLLVASVVFPDLLSADLQDSYGVKTPEDLLKEMIDDPGEYTEFTLFVQNFNGFNVNIDEKIDEAKN
ncbi:MAG: hypothetical protein LBR74_06640 [Eubacterium sp.]|jgi:hypothetical protein|nr:hypothetical protein [Eubacterium sp.]